MNTILILGPGCPKCEELYANTAEAVKRLGIDCEIKKITNINEITNYGVMMTPALVVNDEVKLAGKSVSVEEIMKILS
jgi:small redox-active disulfide protein 2